MVCVAGVFSIVWNDFYFDIRLSDIHNEKV